MREKATKRSAGAHRYDKSSMYIVNKEEIAYEDLLLWIVPKLTINYGAYPHVLII